MSTHGFNGTLLAIAVASLFATGCGSDEETTSSGTFAATVKCAGINSCKGHGDCAGAENACKALNDCKGKGFLNVESEQVCLEQGGKVI